MAEVFFLDFKKIKQKNVFQTFKLLFEGAGFKKNFQGKKLIALKIHFGEEGNPAFVPAPYYLPFIEEIKKLGGRPFFTDTNTLYRGQRDNAASHTLLAASHGFGLEATGTPTIIADGLKGLDGVNVKIAGRHFEEVKIASALFHADAVLVASHFKGHSVTGFGGALKNLGMGSGCRSSKHTMHTDVKPWIEEKACNGCGTCEVWCPVKAITLVTLGNSKKAQIDPAKCCGCGECLIICSKNAIAITWKESSRGVQEKMVEYAQGLVKAKKENLAFINFLINITPDCDCWSFAEPPIVADIGLLASLDPVAIDQASLDLVTQAVGLNFKAGQDKFAALYPEVSPAIQLEYAEGIGLGRRKYNLISIF